MKTIDGKAHALGRAEVFFGDYRQLFTMADQYSKVTRGDAQRVARRYFSARNRTVATLLPETAAAASPGAPSPQP
jgi:zinc protease